MTPETLSHYKVLEKLGDGGMGVVFKAQDTHLNRIVALKVLPADKVANEERKGRFVREARAASSLNHPNIITIHDITSDREIDFIVMEYVAGRTLTQLIPRKGLRVEELLRLAVQIADALAAAHTVGIVHRDLKPGNVMVTESGRVKLLDFGLAKLTDKVDGRDLDVTQTLDPKDGPQTDEGAILGTVSYMSPEQAEGKAVDVRSDIFSFGAVLYEMATGQRAFQGDSKVSTLAAILHKDPKPVSEIGAGLPRELERLIARCLRKDPSRRFQHVDDLKVALEELKEDSDSGRLDAGARAVALSSFQKRRIALWTFAGVAALLIAALAVWQSTGNRPSTPSEPMSVTRLTSSGKATQAAISPDGKYVVHSMDEAGGWGLWMTQAATAGSVRIIQPLQVFYLGLTFSRDGNFLYLVRGEPLPLGVSLNRMPSLGGGVRKLLEMSTATGGMSAVSLSPDGRRLTFIRAVISEGKDVLVVANEDGTQEKELVTRKFPEQYSNRGVSWSPDGRLIACANEDYTAENYVRLVGVDVSSGEVRRLTHDLSGYSNISLTADSSTLAALRSDRVINLWVASEGDSSRARQISSGQGREDGVNGLSWTVDGKIVYRTVAGGYPNIWSMEADGTVQRQLSRDSPENTEASVSPDGRYIVWVSHRANIWRMNVDGSNSRQLTHGGNAYFPQVTPDGKWVVYFVSGYGTETRRVWKAPIDGGTPEPWNVSALVPVPVFSPDGKLFAGPWRDPADSRTKLAVFPSEGGLPIKVFGGAGPPGQQRWAPDGKALDFIRANEGVYNLWRQPIDGSPARQLTHFKDQRIFSFAWSRDGKQLALSRGTVNTDVVLISNFKPK